MGKKYNYYDTPYNDPETVKYRNWETTLLIFAIGVVTTLLMLSYIFNDTGQPDNTTDTQNAVLLDAEPDIPACKPVNMINVGDRNRLIQLLSIANELPIADVQVIEQGEMCYDDNRTPIYTIETDIMVTVDYTPAANMEDYHELGNHVAQILPVMMQITPDNPRQVIIRFLVGETYLEWSHSYNKTNLFTQGLTGEYLWFWTEPDY